MMGLVVGLIIAVALFNLVASLTRLVDEKRGAIAMLMTQGASRRHVAQIFLAQGAMLGGRGVPWARPLATALRKTPVPSLCLRSSFFPSPSWGYLLPGPSIRSPGQGLSSGKPLRCRGHGVRRGLSRLARQPVLPARALH